MEAPAERVAVAQRPRADDVFAYEVFVRDDGSNDPLRHVGAVAAPDAESAYRRATRLFAWYADDVWVAPASEFSRFSTHDLDAEATDAPGGVSGFDGGEDYEEPRNAEWS